ncbi:outer membrane protein assembly factor [Actibacterium pelagium]|uniref:Outer membrane protein assembly factor n=1 Tax=Actibacterium pelagium TaxID=2029103 RepID=A0A917AI59_9RHOB|nr:outer membrane protein assembly factor [Actibacterium pelagium]
MALSGPAFATELRLSLSPDNGDLRDRLRSASLVATLVGDDSVPSSDLLAAARADYGRLISVLYAQAHYGPQISIRADGREVSGIPAFAGPTKIDRISISVSVGPAFTFGRAAAGPLAPQTTLPTGYASGQPARVDTIRDAASSAVKGWRDAGYAKAAIADQRIVADHRGAVLNSDLTLDPGPKLRFGRVAVSDDSAVRPDRIKEIAGVPEGRVFAPEEIARSAQRLRKTGAFRSVSISEDEGIGPNQTQELTIDVVDEKPRRIGVGAEVSSLEGLTLSGLWMHRNLLGGAERLRLEAEVSGIGGGGEQDYGLSARFDRPATFGPDTGLYLGASLADISEPDYDERNLRLEAGLTQQVSDDFYAEVGVSVLRSEFTDDLGSRSRSFLMFPVRGTLDQRDNPMDARTGKYLDLQLMPMIGLNDSSAGLRLQADTRWYHGFGEEDRHVAAVRLQAGSVIGLAQNDIPPSLLFFSGGGGTVRGQSYQSLGVDLGGGDTVGGRSFLGASAELRLAATKKFGVVGFADFGLIGDEAFGGDIATHAGAGLGLRYNTGVGPIRFDLAAPVGGDTGDGVQIYIGIGQAF